MTKIQSVSFLPVNGLYAAYSDGKSYWKKPVIGFACVHVKEGETDEHSVNFIPLDMAHLHETYIFLNAEGFELRKDDDFLGLLHDGSAIDLSAEDMDALDINPQKNTTEKTLS